MTVTIDGTTGIDKVQDGSIVYADLASNIPLGTKNLIINGNMQIAQRGTSTSGLTGDNFNYNSVDRFQTVLFTTTSVWTQSQSTDVPTGQGFSNSLKMDCTTADASLDAGTNITIEHKMEGQNLQHLKKGTASAESLTLSFWVKSNKTGTYIVEIDDNDNARNINNAYTINAADTWEKKTITIDGDTTGTLDNDNGHSLRVIWWLAAGSNYTSGTLQTSWGSTVNTNRAVGSVNLADSTSNYINITGVQLEVGENATPFENRMYSQELAMCQRYYQYVGKFSYFPMVVGFAVSSTQLWLVTNLITIMRASPTVTVGGTALNYVFAPDVASPTTVFWQSNSNSGLSTAGSYRAYNGGGDGTSYFAYSAEL